MAGAEPFRFFIFVESGVLVSPVCAGLFDGWGPLRWRSVRAARLLGFGFVEEAIDETIHGGYSCRIAVGSKYMDLELQSPVIKPPLVSSTQAQRLPSYNRYVVNKRSRGELIYLATHMRVYTVVDHRTSDSLAPLVVALLLHYI